MKEFMITFGLLFFFVTATSAAGSLEDARFYEKFYLASAIRVEAIPTSKIGTGFFAKPEHDRAKLFFVTTKHLVEGANELRLTVLLVDNSKTVVASATLQVPLVKDSLKLYYESPGGIDLALMTIERNLITKARQKIGLAKVEYVSILDEHFTGMGVLFAGQSVLFSGYPLGLSVNGNKPLLRKGSIAGIDTTRNIIYLDADAFGGSSGSPVFVDFSSQANVEFFETYKQMLVGMISGYLFEKRPLSSNSETENIGMVQEENTGIAVVIPAETIRKEVESFLAKQR